MQTAMELENKLGDARFVEEQVLGGDKDIKDMYSKMNEMEKKFEAYMAVKKEKN